MLISVIIPTYNCAQYISEAIESVFDQTYQNFEVIVIDDGSTDDTNRVLSKYIKSKKIKYIYQHNAKQAAARNNGIRNSNGSIIAFLDADDVWLPDKLQKQIPLFSDPDVGLVYGDLVMFNEKGEKPGIHSDEFLRGRIFKDLMMANFICTSSVLIRKECFEKVGGFPEGHEYFTAEDYHLWLRIAKTYQIDYVKDVLLRFRLHPYNSTKDYVKNLKAELRVRKDIVNRYRLNKKFGDRALFDTYSRLCYFSIEDGNKKQALKFYRQGLAKKVFDIRNVKNLIRLLIN